jgi:hypothetical protein
MVAEGTPYGRLAAAVDPTGAQFKLVAPNAAMPARARRGAASPREAASDPDHRSRVQDHGDSAARAPSPGSSRVVR